MSAGYSGTPLVKKLGIKPGTRIALVNAPPDYLTLLGELPAAVSIATTLDGQYDLVQYFAPSDATLTAEFAMLKAAIRHDGALWVSWRKQTVKPAGDLSENRVRELALDHGLVDVKVIAVDATWSGLKLMYRLKDRPT